ncbi:hypothetical protein IWQ57_006307 [Coemansia nantahalensis]|uniref:Uncharacterized protein n=1 Tax=Coemansia nantahalensis TaxID=2789366 RepID=A0ACC1JKL7_9FUNG|nr:hypothetical protein IWQ57_006307 [Coemansia nantahalensis]
MSGQPLFTYHDASVYASDLPSLHVGHWVSDAILAFYFEYLTHEILRGDDTMLLLKPALVQFLRQQTDVKAAQAALPAGAGKKQLVFVPIHSGDAGRADGASHWSLLVLCTNGESPAFHYFDSRANANYAHALATKERMGQVLLGGMHAHMHTHSCPQQENGFDCGVFVILFIDILVRRYADLRLPAAAAAPPSQPQTRPRSQSRPRVVQQPRAGGHISRHHHHHHTPHIRQVGHHHHHHHHHTALGRTHCHSHSARPALAAATAAAQPAIAGRSHFSRYIKLPAGLSKSELIRRPVSPFIRPGPDGQPPFTEFHPAMLRAPAFTHTFWWIDYGDLCNPNMARQMLAALVNRHANQPATKPTRPTTTTKSTTKPVASSRVR